MTALEHVDMQSQQPFRVWLEDRVWEGYLGDYYELQEEYQEEVERMRQRLLLRSGVSDSARERRL